MNIITYDTYFCVKSNELNNRNAVVIDTLRATSTIITALSNGCREVVPVEEVESARAMSKEMYTNQYLLGGERGGVLIDGFNLANSPFEYTKEVVSGKTIIMSTTNGTRALKKAAAAHKTIVCGLINATAVADYLIKDNLDVAIICAGTEGKYTIEDSLTAGMLTSVISKRVETSIDDMSYVSEVLYDKYKDDLYKAMDKCVHANFLKSIGFDEDIKYCLSPDRYDIVPFYEKGVIKI